METVKVSVPGRRIHYEAAFGYEGLADASAITEHIKNIRAKLRPLNERPIETVWGVGYKWKKE